jgi:hypothetical protein
MNIKPFFSKIDLPTWWNYHRISQDGDIQYYQDNKKPQQTRVHKAGFDAERDELSGQGLSACPPDPALFRLSPVYE